MHAPTSEYKSLQRGIPVLSIGDQFFLEHFAVVSKLWRFEIVLAPAT